MSLCLDCYGDYVRNFKAFSPGPIEVSTISFFANMYYSTDSNCLIYASGIKVLHI